MMAADSHYAALLAALVSQESICPAALRCTAAREAALQVFLATGLPSRREEAWKYTDVAQYTQGGLYSLATPMAEPGAIERERGCVARSFNAAARLVFVNGFFSSTLSDLSRLPDGVQCLPISQIAALDPVCLHSLLAHPPVSCHPGLLAWNTAFFTDGWYVYVPAGVVVSAPIHLLSLATECSQACMIQQRHLIHLAPNSRAVIIEEHCYAPSARPFKNEVATVHVSAGAQLTYYQLQQASQAAPLSHRAVQQGRDTHFRSHTLALGAAFGRDTLHVALTAEGAVCALEGLYTLSGVDRVDHHTEVVHQAPHTTSDEYYKGILRDTAKAVFNGRVVVQPGAKKTLSHQLNKNLLLSQGAVVNTKPELEIYADDIRCTHGATVGQLSAEALFYLRSRGLSKAQAEAMLAQAFSEEIFARMADPLVVDYLKQIVFSAPKQVACV